MVLITCLIKYVLVSYWRCYVIYWDNQQIDFQSAKNLRKASTAAEPKPILLNVPPTNVTTLNSGKLKKSVPGGCEDFTCRY